MMTSEPRNPDSFKRRFLHDVLEGLARGEKAIPCKYFYDERGSRLFEQICELEEYHLTRSELEIMRSHAGSMAERIGPGCLLVELGSGSSIKTTVLLDRLTDPAGFVPVDISGEALRAAAARLDRRYRSLQVRPVLADFTQFFQLPAMQRRPARTVVYFPGSTIGNFGPREASALFGQIAGIAGAGGGLLIGFDLFKPREKVEPAYNDRKGVTAAFNLNVLARINRELGGDFDLGRFEHLAFFDEACGRIEMHLVSTADQSVRIADACIEFVRGERIHTENSYKYSLEQFRELAEGAQLELEDVWFDEQRLFCVQYLTVRS